MASTVMWILFFVWFFGGVAFYYHIQPVKMKAALDTALENYGILGVFLIPLIVVAIFLILE